MENPFLGMDGIRNYENEVQDEILKNANDVDENVPAFNHAMTSNRSAFSAHKPSAIQLISNARKTLDEILSRSAFKSASDLEDEVVDGGDDDGGGNSMSIKTRTKEKVTHAEGVLFPPNQPQNESTEGSHEDEENDSSASPYNSQRSPTSILVTEPGEGDEAIDDNSDLEQNDNFQNLTTNLNERFLQPHLPHNLLQSRVPNFNEENASQISARNGKELEGTNSFSNLQSSTQTTVIYIPTPSPQLPFLETSLHIAAEERHPTLAPTSYGVEREKASLQHQKMGKRKVEKISSSLPPRKRKIATTACSYTTTIFKRVSRPILYRYKCTHCPAFFRRPQRIQSHSNLHLPRAYAEICRVNNCGWYVVPGEMTRHHKEQHPGLQKRGQSKTKVQSNVEENSCLSAEILPPMEEVNGGRYFQTPAGNADPYLVPPTNHPPPILNGNSRSEPLLPCIIQSEKGATCSIMQSRTTAPPGSYRVIDGSPNIAPPHQPSTGRPVVNSAQNNSMLERSDDVNKLSTLEPPKHSERLRQKLSTEALPAAAKKIVTTKAIRLRRHSSDGRSSRNPLSSKDKPTYTKRPNGRSNYLQCNKCPAWEFRVERINEHLLLHHEGSPSIPCADCGWTVLPQQLESHRSRIHSDSTPDYTVHKRPSYLQFECKQCPATLSTLRLINTHLMLHRPDSKAQICKVQNCGWLVDPVKMNRHCMYHHPEERLKCRKCPAKFDRRLKMKKHQLLHRRGIGVDCEKCRWRVGDLSHHNSRWHSVGEEENRNEGG